ncbi:MAG TPA: hypothetical protein VGX37_12225, partial [Allosphingosinicella sp.]|nr:hypothetical protein [Allosphingosinicella sp.]
TLPDEVERLVLTGSSAIDGAGNAMANILTGNSAANKLAGGGGNDVIQGGAGGDSLDGGSGGDRLDGGTGADTMQGGDGDDIYLVENSLDKAIEVSAGGGLDEVQSSVSFTLGSNVEKLTLVGTSAINATGNGIANTLTGNAAANVLNGAAGADTMVGGSGNDTYVVDNALDRAVERSATGGTDTVNSSVSFALVANIERLVLTGSSAINGTGNTLANSLTGNAAANVLNGGAGADAMAGGGGDDTYIVDNALDKVVEASATGGTDTVNSSVSFVLGANIEKLVLTGSSAIRGTGNTLANSLTGNAAANFLNGGAGADTMSGGAGNDIYVVDNALDRAVETSATNGIDTVNSSVSFTLGANLEKLVLTGSVAINGTGNGLANSLSGNSAANSLNGGAGADFMSGGDGNDLYFVDDAGDKAVETRSLGGTDAVSSTVSFTLGAYVENLTLTGLAAVNGTGNGLANVITGNGAANILAGASGADTLSGGGGRDELHGGTGRDTLQGGASIDSFVFDTALLSSNVDHVVDFTRGTDKLVLEDAVFTGLAPGSLPSGALVIGTSAGAADDRIIYDPSTGALLFDRDGSGSAAAVQFAILDNKPATLSANDFLVI